MKAQPFQLKFAAEVKEHLAYIDKQHHSLIRATIKEQLAFEPDVRTRNRKPLARASRYKDAWELRFGPQNCFRVFYRIAADDRRVDVIAIGYKEGNKLFIGGEEIEL